MYRPLWIACLVLLAATASLAAQSSQPASRPASQPAKEMGWTGVLDEAAFAALHELKKGEAPRLHGKMIQIEGAKAYLSMPKGGKPHAAVLVIHEWWGLNNHVKHWTDRLAADGYAALAIDLYGGVVATNRDEARNAMGSVDSQKALATLKAAHTFLARDPEIAAKKRACIGWCFGGGWSLQLALAAPDLDAAVIYYGRLVEDPEKLKAIKAPVLGVFGNQDRSIAPDKVNGFEKAMKTAGRSVQVLRYDANHAFANPSSARYSKKHASAAWEEVRCFLDEKLATADRFGTFSVGAKKIRYWIPRGWKAARKRPMRNVNLTIAGGVECYVTVLGGTGGGIAPNLNRWCQQMGEEVLSAEEIDALPRLAMIDRKAPMLAVSGSYSGMTGEAIKDARMLGVVCPLANAAVFVKMLGPKKAVMAQQVAFRRFCESMK